MATSAFKSTTKRTPIGTKSKADDSCGSSDRVHRRSRSLSRFSRMTEPEPDFGDSPAPRGRFVNTVRGSGFPEISLDDLATEFFPLKDSVDCSDNNGRGRSSRRSSEVSRSTSATVSSQRRGRSVSRHNSRMSDGKGSVANASGGSRTNSDSISRRRRSVSVARYQISDSESDLDHSRASINHTNGNSQVALSKKPQALGNRRLGRSSSQKDLLKSYDGYSSQSSALTDDEGRDIHYGKKGVEKTIRAVYAQKAKHPTADNMSSGLYEAMRKELRYAVEEIKTELEQGRTSPLANGNSTKNYAAELEQSEKRRQDLLAEIVLEEQRGKELSKIVRELLPDSKRPVVARKPLQSRKRSSDRNRMSERLTEEAEKYFEDFISNVEDTDFSSFDGERSDASSSLGGIITKSKDAKINNGETKTSENPAGYNNSLPVEMEGVNLPWLKWETNNDGSPLITKNKVNHPVTPKSLLWDDAVQDGNNCTNTSGYLSWSPGTVDSHLVNNGETSGSKGKFEMDEYIMLQKKEDLLFEIWREQHRLSSGGLLLCNQLL